MFSNTAFEALYQYLGLELHSKFIEVLTSQQVFLAVLFLIFGFMFFTVSIHFFSKYLPGALVMRRNIPLSRYAKIIACLFLGMSLLRLGSNTNVKQYSGRSWHENSYVQDKIKDVKDEYRVSFIFDILSRSAEEVSAFINKTVDSLFITTNSQLDAPNFFYKAILYAGSSTINDPALRSSVEFYTEECLEKVLPLVGNKESLDKMDSFFGNSHTIDEKLSLIQIDNPERPGLNCLIVKNEVRGELRQYAIQTTGPLLSLVQANSRFKPLNDAAYQNLQVSTALVDYYLDQHEGFLGIQKGAQTSSGAARIYQYINRLFSWDSLSTLVAGRDTQGASLSAKRAQEFSENLTRAPHVAGFIKLFLIALFPWLVFPIVAGHWRVLLFWYLGYFSVLMWAPLWTLFYHIMTGITISAEVLSAFGRLSDGVSLYSASLITSRMNYMFAVYSWIQLLIGIGFSGVLFWFMRPVLSDSETSKAPEFVETASSVGSTIGRVL